MDTTGTGAAEAPRHVSEERWLRAQQWERQFWDRQNVPPPLWKRALRPLLVAAGLRPRAQRSPLDDRNHWWAQQFDGYRILPRDLESICELGCGPYTNTRLILEGREARHVHCSDPLAATYVTYERAWLARAHRAGRIAVDFHSAEETVYRSDCFAVTVLINVLDHVRDPWRCLSEAMRITAPGGLLVFGQDLTGPGDQRPNNPGHPFTFSLEDLEPVLEDNFDCLHRRMVPRSEVDEPQLHYGALAWIGRKRESTRMLERQQRT